MPFTLTQFSTRRPYLYHLTSRTNVPRLAATRRLEPAAELLGIAGRPFLVQRKRTSHLTLSIAGREVTLRDQAPLHEGNIRFEDGWTFPDLVSALNSQVYFWPGDEFGPNDYAWRHFERYRAERPVLLRVRFASLQNANPSLNAVFCAYNSGSPRCSAGLKSPRGPATFVAAESFPKGPGGVVEVTFPSSVALPPDVECADDYAGPWRRLTQ